MRTARKIAKGILFVYSIIFTGVLVLGAASFGIESGNYLLPALSIPIVLYFLATIFKIKRGRKILLFYSFLIVSLMTISGFKGAESLSQLTSVLFFLPITVYFWMQALPRRKKKIKLPHELLSIIPGTEITSEKEPIQKLKKIEDEYPPEKFGKNFDLDRRMFLKLIGSAGISVFMLAIFTRKAQAAFFGSVPGPGTVALKNTSGVQIDPAQYHPTDGYKINQLDDSSPAYYGFTEKGGAWFIMKEDSSGNYRYTKGTSAFSTNWTNRASLTYDYYDVIF